MSKRRLFVMRHAKSSWKSNARTDHARPLNNRGLRDAPRIAAHLVQNDWIPELVISSDSERTRQTWGGMEAEFPGVEVRFTRSLYHAGYEEVRDALAEIPDSVSNAMVLGHNPGWEEVVETMSGEAIRMTTANVVVLEGEGKTWEKALERTPWRVADVIRPKEI